MKHWIIILVSVLTSTAIAFLLVKFMTGEEVAIVRTAVVLERYQGAADARAKLQGNSQVWSQAIDTMRSELQRLMDVYKSGPLSAKQRDSVAEAVQTSRAQLEQYADAVGKKAQEQEAILTDGVVTQLRAAVASVARKRGIKLVMADSPQSDVLFGEQGVDVTQDVLEELNTLFVKGGADTTGTK